MTNLSLNTFPLTEQKRNYHTANQGLGLVSTLALSFNYPSRGLGPLRESRKAVKALKDLMDSKLLGPYRALKGPLRAL